MFTQWLLVVFSLLGVKAVFCPNILNLQPCMKDWQSHKAVNCSVELANMASSCLSHFKHQWSRWQQSQMNSCKCLLASLSQRNQTSPHIALFSKVSLTADFVSHVCYVLDDSWWNWATAKYQNLWRSYCENYSLFSSWKVNLLAIKGCSGAQLPGYMKREWTWARRNRTINRLLWVYRSRCRSSYRQTLVTAAACHF